jgi:hypothetical protein
MWSDLEGSLPILGGPSGAIVAVRDIGAGRIVLLADASALQNRGLADADNAALGLSLVGGPGRPVTFVESVHGFSESRGLAAIPTRWKWMLLGWGVAIALAMWTIGKRLGPPQRAGRVLPPPRRIFVESLAGAIGRTGDRDGAIEPIKRHALARLARMTGLTDPSQSALREVASEVGIELEERNALFGPATDDGSVVAAGRALARLRRGS